MPVPNLAAQSSNETVTEPLNSEPEIVGIQDVPESQTLTSSSAQVELKNPCTCQCHLKDSETRDQNVSRENEDEAQNENREEIIQPIYTLVENSSIFLVCIDGHPYFYASSLEEARNQAEKYLKALQRNPDYTYTIEEEDERLVLVSHYKWYIIAYDTVESVAEIYEISRVEFTKDLEEELSHAKEVYDRVMAEMKTEEKVTSKKSE